MDSSSVGPATAAGAPQFVGFELAGQHYAFRIDRIREIVIPSSVASLPDVPAYIDGVSNLRGTIIPIVNLRGLFGLPQKPIDAETRTVVVTVGPRIMGCLVDSVSRVMRIAPEQIQPAPDAFTAAGRSSVEGVARVGDDLCILLDVESLLDPAHLEEVHRAGAPALHDRPTPSGAA